MSESPGSSVDAVVVPAARGWPSYAAGLAGEAGARLFSVGPVALPRPAGMPLLPGEERRAGNDLAWRRREGVRQAARAGAQVVLLLDDDISGLSRQHLAWGLEQLGAGREAVSYPAVQFPDNSSVYHAWRAAGRQIGVRTAASALLVRTGAAVREEWRWAPVYNEDWLFLDGLDVVRGPYPVTQDEYDPWAPGRAWSEEAGEVLGFGIRYQGGGWARQLRRRARFLARVGRLRMPAAARASVEEARAVCAMLRPAGLEAWERAWLSRSPVHDAERAAG